MFGAKDQKKEPPINTDVVETIIGANSEINGDVTSAGSIRVDGKMFGTIRANGNIIIGEKGLLEGDATATNVVVAGKVKGNIKVSKKVEINSTGNLLGDMVAKTVVIEDGALFTGNCKMESTSQPLLKDGNKTEINKTEGNKTENFKKHNR